MKLIDLNLFIYAFDSSAERHLVARRWLEHVLSGRETVALAWVVMLGFVRLTTNTRVFAEPMEVDEALDVVDSWLA